MTTYDPTNRGKLSKNDRKEQPNHPDYRGQINIAGVDYWLNGWIKDGDNGKWLSLSVKPRTPPVPF